MDNSPIGFYNFWSKRKLRFHEFKGKNSLEFVIEIDLVSVIISMLEQGWPIVKHSSNSNSCSSSALIEQQLLLHAHKTNEYIFFHQWKSKKLQNILKSIWRTNYFCYTRSFSIYFPLIISSPHTHTQPRSQTCTHTHATDI